MKRLLIAGLLAALSGFCTASRAEAQILGRWFGPKTPDKSAPAKATQIDPRKVAAMNLEIAWLADPVTFPYYLEAHPTGSQIEVRGYVPNKQVREQALRIAQVQTSMSVVDSMKEHSSLLVKSGQMSAQQLQTSVQSSLRVALPKQHQQLKVACNADGTVIVSGPVTSMEEKVAVSHSLRRLHGCTSVQNQTTVPGEIAQLKSGPQQTPANNPTPGKTPDKSKTLIPWPFAKNNGSTKDEPPLLDVAKPKPPEPKTPAVVVKNDPVKIEGPILIPSVGDNKDKPKEIVKTELPTPAPKTTLSVAELQKRVQAAYPQAKGVEVQFVSSSEVRITLEIRAESELNAAAEAIFAMPELQNYRPDLQFRVGAP